MSTWGPLEINEIAKLSRDKKKQALHSLVSLLLTCPKAKDPFANETDFKKGVVSFDVDKFHSDSFKRKQYDSLFKSIDEATKKQLISKKTTKQCLSDIANVINILKVKDLDMQNEDSSDIPEGFTASVQDNTQRTDDESVAREPNPVMLEVPEPPQYTKSKRSGSIDVLEDISQDPDKVQEN